MKRKLLYWLALWIYRFYLYRDRFMNRIRRNLTLMRDDARTLAAWLRRQWGLWIDPPNSTRYIDCAIVNRRTYWLQCWALRGLTIALLVSLMTHLPAPTGERVQVSDPLEIERDRRELAETVAAQQQLRAENYRIALDGMTGVVERLRSARRDDLRRSVVGRIRAVNPNTDALRIAEAILTASNVHGVPRETLLAVAEIESHFRPDAVSKAGARGVMQVLPWWEKRCPGLDTLEGEIMCGTRILRYECGRATTLKDCLTAYNGSTSNHESANRYWKKFTIAMGMGTFK